MVRTHVDRRAGLRDSLRSTGPPHRATCRIGASRNVQGGLLQRAVRERNRGAARARRPLRLHFQLHRCITAAECVGCRLLPGASSRGLRRSSDRCPWRRGGVALRNTLSASPGAGMEGAQQRAQWRRAPGAAWICRPGGVDPTRHVLERQPARHDVGRPDSCLPRCRLLEVHQRLLGPLVCRGCSNPDDGGVLRHAGGELQPAGDADGGVSAESRWRRPAHPGRRSQHVGRHGPGLRQHARECRTELPA